MRRNATASFPLPDYDLSNEEVEMHLYGEVIDLEYTRLLARNEDLSLEDVMILDRVQKGKVISTKQAKHLKSMGCLEGRKPNYHLSASVASLIDQKADYIRQKGLDDSFYQELILSLIREYTFVDRREIDKLIYPKLPDILDEKQKKIKIKTLLAALKRKGLISNTGTRRHPKWALTSQD